MIICIDNVLQAEMREEIATRLAEARFDEGAATAGWHARSVKHNRQLRQDRTSSAVGRIVTDALTRHELFRAAALPKSMRPFLISRYEAGMEYGSHVDDALMGDPPARSDISVTVFLSAPEDYEGGELIVESTGGETNWKLDAGAAILYPSTSLHRVAPVTSGRRDAAVGWIQSLVRSPERREILFDLDTARRSLFARSGKNRDFDLIAKSYANLLRLWAEP